MARKPRVFVEGGVYHVYNRIASGEGIFSDPDEAVEFIELIRKVKKRDGWTVFAWVVMSNHYHLVIRTGTTPLWRGMHAIQNSFSRGFNRRHRRTGGLWQGRYQARNVSDQTYLDRLVLYVHLNPVKAGLVDDPQAYVFAGHREVKRKIRDPLVEVDDMLLCFGTTKREARRRYLAAVRAGVRQGGDVPERNWHPFVNDPELELRARMTGVDELGRSVGIERPRLDSERFVELVCKIAEIDPEQLASRARDHEIAEARRLVVTLGAERWDQNRQDLARVLNKNPDVVSWWVGEGARRRVDDPAFAARLDDLDQRLSLFVRAEKGEIPANGATS